MEPNLDNQDVENRRQASNRQQGNIWSKLLFQRIFLFSLVRMIIYINKVYQDVGAVETYYAEKSKYFAIISILSLVAPSLIYAIYLTFEEIVRASKIELKNVSTKFINGLLLMPWQIKRHLDGLYFASQRLCSFRPPKVEETENISGLNRSAEVLEFFEDFYAGFLQILLQLYILYMEVNSLLEKKSLLVGELVGSAMSVFSMLIAIRRRDDGILTGFLSFIGWTSMFASRVLVFSLSTTIFKVYFLLFYLVHSLVFSIWVYKIAVASHQEHELAVQQSEAIDNTGRRRKRVHQNRFQLAILVYLFFGLPSLVMWPIMFQLKEQKRPLVFLFVNTIENVIFLLIWYFAKETNTTADLYSLLIVVIATLVADLFLSGYILCKPKLTDQIVLHERRKNTDTESFGIYYEFCDIVFKLKVQTTLDEELEEIRRIPENGSSE